jgi:acid phosphatase
MARAAATGGERSGERQRRARILDGMRCVPVLAVIAAAALGLAGCGQSTAGEPLPVGRAGSLPKSARSHVVVIVMENKEAGTVLGSAPYLASLARRGGVATRSYGVRHPSLPNYLALTSGSTHGITTDCTSCHVGGRNLVDQLQAAHLSWKAYLEDLPSPCFTGASAGGYAKKHNPFVYYDDVVRDPARCRRVQPFTRLAGDLRRGRLPTYAFIAPNLCDDTHDCPVGTGDRFLAHVAPALLRELGPHGLIVVTWDEGDSDKGCCGGSRGGHITTVVAGPDVRAGAREVVPVDHYGVLRTIEDALGLGHLGAAADPRHGSLRGLFTRPPR